MDANYVFIPPVFPAPYYRYVRTSYAFFWYVMLRCYSLLSIDLQCPGYQESNFIPVNHYVYIFVKVTVLIILIKLYEDASSSAGCSERRLLL